MKVQILSCERDQQIVLRNDEGKVMYDSIQTYDELGSAGRDAVKDVITDIANLVGVSVEEDEVSNFIGI